MRLRSITVFLALMLGSVHAALAYDDAWYRSNGWGGEYPNGFTMTEDTTVPVRSDTDPDSAASIDCLLRKDATYHQWNEKRVAADGLEFVTFSKIEDYRLTKNFTANVQTEAGADAKLRFKKGDRWSFLTYIGEGFFVMRYRDKVYNGDQDLIEASAPVDPGADERPVDEWMKLTCGNAATGWLLFADVREKPGFGSPNITDYGSAADGRARQQ